MTFAPNRRWFRWSLRTMFLVVTACALALGWFTWQWSIVGERRRVLNEFARIGPRSRPDDSYVSTVGDGDDYWRVRTRQYVPLMWRLLGAEPVSAFRLDERVYTDSDAARLADLFPEAIVGPTWRLDAEGSYHAGTSEVTYRSPWLATAKDSP